MDCELPILDGYQATQQIRKWESKNSHSACPIVAVSAHAFDNHLEKVKRAGMDDQLYKPIQTDELRRVLSDVALQ